MKIQEVKIGGLVYAYCTDCRMYGEVGWAHVCGVNWYPTVEEVNARARFEIRADRKL